MPSPTYFRKKGDPIYMRKIGDPHIVMYNPVLAESADYISGWVFEDLLPRGMSHGDIHPKDVIRPPALGGPDLGMRRVKRAEESTMADALNRQEIMKQREQEQRDQRMVEKMEAETPAKDEQVPDESPENWRNWSKKKLILHAKEVVGIKIHPATGRDNVVKKIEEALHYVDAEPEAETEVKEE